MVAEEIYAKKNQIILNFAYIYLRENGQIIINFEEKWPNDYESFRNFFEGELLFVYFGYLKVSYDMSKCLFFLYYPFHVTVNE